MLTIVQLRMPGVYSHKIAVPTNRERKTLVKVVNLCLLTPGKMMMKARKRVTNTMQRVRVLTSAVTGVRLL